MPITVLDNLNLIGDALYAIAPMEKYIDAHPDETCIIKVRHNLAAEVCKKHFAGKAEVVFTTPEGDKMIKLNPSAAHGFCIPQGFHISRGYAEILDVPWTNANRTIPDSWAAGWNGYHGKWDESAWMYEGLDKVVAISPFSISGRSNKAISRPEAVAICDKARRQGYTPVLFGYEDFEPSLDIEVRFANGLEDFTRFLRSIKMLVVCDNGVSHLASALGIRTIVFWKKCCEEFWIAPNWGRRTTLAYTIQEVCNWI
jgi:hypothetical protein